LNKYLKKLWLLIYNMRAVETPISSFRPTK
jgi:hypothetical protein